MSTVRFLTLTHIVLLIAVVDHADTDGNKKPRRSGVKLNTAEIDQAALCCLRRATNPIRPRPASIMV